MSSEDSATPDPNPGLEARFNVEKIDDPTGKHADCRYFVLDPVHDKRARKVLLEYASLAAQDDDDQLAVDIIEWVGQIELREHHPRLAVELDEEVARREAVDGVSPDEALKVSPAPEQAPRAICPVHNQTDCSPLLNGCSELTKVIRTEGDGSPMDKLLGHFGVQGTFMIEDHDPAATLREADPTFPSGKPMVIDGSGIYRDPENKGGYSMHFDPIDGKRI